MVSDRALADTIQELVGRFEHVIGAKANPTSGSLLVTYDPGTAEGLDLPSMIQGRIETWLRDYRGSAGRPAPAQGTALLRVLEVSGHRPGDRLVPSMLTMVAHSLTLLQG